MTGRSGMNVRVAISTAGNVRLFAMNVRRPGLNAGTTGAVAMTVVKTPATVVIVAAAAAKSAALPNPAAPRRLWNVRRR